jgi:linearmycin/streptolysin S transport system permease protein
MKIIDIAFKDLLRSFRSLFAIGMMFVAPLLITGLIYAAFGNMSAGTGKFNLPPLKILIVNQDQPVSSDLKLGQMLLDFFHDARMPSWLEISTANDEATARAAIDQQQAGVAIIVPADFTAQAIAPIGHTSLRLIADPTLTIGPRIVQDILNQFIDGISGGKIALQVVSTQLQANGKSLDPTTQAAIAQDYSAWFQSLQQNLHHSTDPIIAVQSPTVSTDNAARKTDSSSNMMARVMAGMLIFFAFFGAASSAQSILTEDEEGTLARLFTTPTSRTTILFGKFVGVFIIVIVQSIVLLIASSIVFNITWGQPITIVLVTIGLVVIATGFGLLVMSLIKTARQSGPVLGGALTVTGMLGGLFTVAIPNVPDSFNTLTLFMPQGWALRSWLSTIDGASPTDVLLPVVVMLLLGIGFFAVGVTLFRKRFA